MTAFPALDELLRELVTGQQVALGESFVGTYMTGSFALGDADEWSDVDFLTVVERPMAVDEQQRITDLHQRLFMRATHWAQHLEGSYAPRDDVRAKNDAKWFFLDNGATELELDRHCNSALVRWTILERTVTLAGPDPAALIDPVAPDELREEARAAVREYAAWAHASHEGHPSGMSRWKQPYVVLTLCRALHTVETAEVRSKRESAEWALRALDPQWHDLVAAALADRPHPWERVHQDSTPELVARTRAFADSLLA